MGDAARRSEVLPRGVYEATYRVEGYEVLVAIDSAGNARKHVKLKPGVSYARAKAWLEDVLDRIDPPRELRLLNASSIPAPSRPLPSRRPTHADDFRAYRRRLARAAAAKIRIFDD